jgi:fructuronate reductase
MRTFLRRFWAEAAETLDMPQGFDVALYTRDLEKRFENRALRHLTAQIARDGSQKLPQRLLGTVRDRLAADRRIPALALATAAWMRHVTGRGEDGREFAVEDPLGGELAQRVSGAVQPAEIVRNLVSVNSIFGDDLASDRRFLGPVTQALDVLCRGGTNHALALAASQ